MTIYELKDGTRVVEVINQGVYEYYKDGDFIFGAPDRFDLTDLQTLADNGYFN